MVRVLIVSSYFEVREGLFKVLELAGGIALINPASSFEDAVQKARSESPDVVLVDLEMPGFEGLETISQLKVQCPSTKSIALTAHDYQAAWQQAMSAGAFSVIVKGLDVSAMVAAIQVATGESRS
jgi:two-component system, NarL family, invasion response regulator UvrY